MDVRHGAALSKGSSASDKPRPMAHGQFKLLPVPKRGHREWNDRYEAWARAA